MLENLTRARAAILLALVALSLGWSLTVRPVQPEPGVIVDKTYDDRDLFREIAKRVGEGDSYYLAATTLQRQHHYPTQPFMAVRPPTLTLLGVTFGWQAMHIAMLALLGLAVAAWYPHFARATRIERIAAALAIFIGGAHATQFEFVVWYEIWAGLLIAIALALRRGRFWLLSFACVALALAIREFAVTYIALALPLALWERRWREAACWTALVALFGLGMAIHAGQIMPFVQPGDVVSPGWSGLRGPQAVLQDLATHSMLFPIPVPLVYLVALLGPIGWLGLPARESRFAMAWMALFSMMIAIATRPNTDYWCMVMLPTWFLGYAFLPRVALRLTSALAGRKTGL